MMTSGLTIPDRGAREQAEAAATAEGQGKVTVFDVKRERQQLAEANRHVAQAQKHIANQKKQIEKLMRGGHDIDVAVSMLHALEQALHAFERHREFIMKRLKDDE
jgi:outer membrane protein TolC